MLTGHLAHPTHGAGGLTAKKQTETRTGYLRNFFYPKKVLPIAFRFEAKEHIVFTCATKRLGVIRGDRNSDVKQYFSLYAKEPISDRIRKPNLVDSNANEYY